MATVVPEDTVYTYNVGGNTYRVPTYGTCWKLIDFGSAQRAAAAARSVVDISRLIGSVGGHLGMTAEDAVSLSALQRCVLDVVVFTRKLHGRRTTDPVRPFGNRR